MYRTKQNQGASKMLWINYKNFWHEFEFNTRGVPGEWDWEWQAMERILETHLRSSINRNSSTTTTTTMHVCSLQVLMHASIWEHIQAFSSSLSRGLISQCNWPVRAGWAFELSLVSDLWIAAHISDLFRDSKGLMLLSMTAVLLLRKTAELTILHTSPCGRPRKLKKICFCIYLHTPGLLLCLFPMKSPNEELYLKSLLELVISFSVHVISTLMDMHLCFGLTQHKLTFCL